MSERPHDRRFPHDPFAFGWYQIDYGDQLKRGQVKPWRAFGRDFVLWRDADGAPHLFDAFCPHLGAHLGHGGRVEGNVLRCPFHGWRFDDAGRCAGIPYSPEARLGASRNLTSWPVVERNGLLLGWWHPDGAAPAFDTPVLPEWGDRGWSRYRRHHWRANTVWQEIQENIVDSTHFHYLHGVESLAVVDRCDPIGPVLDVNILHRFKTPVGVEDGFIQTTLYGPFFATVRFRIGDVAEILFVDAVTPIETDVVDVRFSLLAKLDGVRIPDMSLALVDEAIRQVSEDVPIWNHKMHWQTPSLAPGDGPVMKFRNWAKQFRNYNEIKDTTRNEPVVAI